MAQGISQLSSSFNLSLRVSFISRLNIIQIHQFQREHNPRYSRKVSVSRPSNEFRAQKGLTDKGPPELHPYLGFVFSKFDE